MRSGVWRIGRFLFLASAMCGTSLPAGDWPQILGPQRNGSVPGEKLPARIGPATVKLAWEYRVGSGYAGPAVQGGRVIVFHRLADNALADCLDAKTGRRIWRNPEPTSYRPGIDPDDGPLCVPTIGKDRLFLFGAGAMLRCVSLKDGRTLWSRDLKQDYQVPTGYFGSGSSPLLVGDRLLVNVGGREAGLAAFSIADGKTLWSVRGEQASYAAPVKATFDGRQQAIFVTRQNCVSIDPADGRQRFSFPFGKRGPTVNAASPLVIGDHLFLTASYGVGAVWASVGDSGATTVWSNDRTLSSQYVTPVYHDGHLYGIDGRQDAGAARLRCLDPTTGEVLWSENDFGIAVPILADGKLLLISSTGRLTMCRATPDAFDRLGSIQVANTTVRALPALSNGRLYIREKRNLKCFTLSR